MNQYVGVEILLIEGYNTHTKWIIKHQTTGLVPKNKHNLELEC